MKTFSLILNICMSVGILPAAFMAMMSPMMFDSGATTRTWVLFWCVASLPVVILLSQIAAWIFYTKGLYPGSIKFALIPFINLILLVIMFMMSDKLM